MTVARARYATMAAFTSAVETTRRCLEQAGATQDEVQRVERRLDSLWQERQQLLRELCDTELRQMLASECSLTSAEAARELIERRRRRDGLLTRYRRWRHERELASTLPEIDDLDRLLRDDEL